MKKYLIVFFLLSTGFAKAEIVNKLVVEGNKKISQETIAVYGDIELNKDYSRADTNEILKKLYSTDFFEDVSIQLTNKTLTITVKEYSTINKISFEGEKAKKIKKAILERLISQEKNSYIQSSLNRDINVIKAIYGTLGFNFVQVDAKIEKLSEDRINLVFFVDKGEKTKISKINFVGDKKIKERRLRDIIVSEEHKPWKFLSKNTNLTKSNIELDERLLTNYYKSMGFYDVQVLATNAEINDSNYTNLTFNIDAGQRYVISKIATNINEVIDKKAFLSLNGEFKKTVGKYYSPFTVKKLLENVDFVIADNDLQFVEHSVNEVLEGNKIEIIINIYEGSKQTVERINIKGNNITNETVIRGELLIDEGDPFNKLKLEKSIAKLKSKDIFGEVNYVVKNSSSADLKIIDIEVEEKPTGELSAGAGFGTTGGSLAFSVKENNWLGRGMRVNTFVDFTKDTFKGAIKFVDPNYNFSGNELNYIIATTTNDKPDSGYKNSTITTGIGTKFEQYRDVYFLPSVDITVDDLEVTSGASKALQKQKGKFTDFMFNYGLELDKRDRAFMPTDGYISAFTQALPVYADTPYVENTYAFGAFRSINENIVGAFKFYASAVNGIDDDVRISKRNFVSSGRLRGFKAVGPKDNNDYVGGNYVAAMNFETNLPTLLPESTKTDVGLFLDFGNVWGVDYDSQIDDSNKIRSSAGTVINWTSPLGPMSFTLAKDITKATTDKTETFNFRLGTTF